MAVRQFLFLFLFLHFIPLLDLYLDLPADIEAAEHERVIAAAVRARLHHAEQREEAATDGSSSEGEGRVWVFFFCGKKSLVFLFPTNKNIPR